jgi:hypothetical protein
MTMRSEIWIVLLRPNNDNVIGLEGVISLGEMTQATEIRLRYNPDIHLFTIRVPPGTRRTQVIDAFELLSVDEKSRAYNARKHKLANARKHKLA